MSLLGIREGGGGGGGVEGKGERRCGEDRGVEEGRGVGGFIVCNDSLHYVMYLKRFPKYHLANGIPLKYVDQQKPRI